MEHLPTEIIRGVCGALCGHCNALANLRLTSSRLRAIAQPFLYHSIFVRQRKILGLISIFDTFISRPDLAAAVRHLVLDTWCGTEPVSDEVLSRLMHQLLRQNPHIEFPALMASSQDASGLLPSVDGPFAPSLPALRKVVLDYSDIGHGFDFLNVTRCCNISCTLSLQNVTFLILTYCYISTNDMSRLLSSCGKLDTFAYESVSEARFDMIGDEDGDDDEDGLSANELVHVLEEQGHSSTLRRLSLDYSEDVRDDIAMIDSLVNFSQLQELWLRHVVLRLPETVPADAPAGVLPASLGEIGLYSRRPENAAIDGLGFIAAQAPNGFSPRLEKLTFDYGDDNWCLNDGEEKDSRRGFQELNIVFSTRADYVINDWIRQR
ncbi:hypothetical protein F5B21DRAFT_516231 [Xylaria acuta]|nr:hypothetical protein F5B21DRAFT_516231 [Xylaria acuta]